MLTLKKGQPKIMWYELSSSTKKNSRIIAFSNVAEPVVIGNSTTLRGVSPHPPNPFKDVLACSILRSALLISSRVDLNRTLTELPVSTKIRSNFLLATVALMMRASSCWHNTHSSSLFVHMMGTCLVFACLATGVLKNISLLVIAYIA